MANPIARLAVRWYYRHAYGPEPLGTPEDRALPAAHHLTTVPWIAVALPACQSVLIQMVAACFGQREPRSHFDFLMGFTYGATSRSDAGFLPVGTDPETGLMTAAPRLGLHRRYLYTSNPAQYGRALRATIASGLPVRVPLDMGALYSSQKRIPHNELLVGYNAEGFHYYEPTSLPPAPCTPGERPAGATGLFVADDCLLDAVAREADLFGYPWRFAFVVFTPSTPSEDLTAVWEQNSAALIGGRRFGQISGAAAIEEEAARIQRAGAYVDSGRILDGLAFGAVTRSDNAAYLRARFPQRAVLEQAAMRFDEASRLYSAAHALVAVGKVAGDAARTVAAHLDRIAALEREAGFLFKGQTGGAEPRTIS